MEKERSSPCYSFSGDEEKCASVTSVVEKHRRFCFAVGGQKGELTVLWSGEKGP